MSQCGIELIRAEWPAPANVHAVTTTRKGGASRIPYQGFNLALHVGDEPEHVIVNRRALGEQLGVEARAHWLQQVHGAQVVDADAVNGAAATALGAAPEGDAWVCFKPGHVCAVLTADCLPVFFCDREGTRVGIAHAGWRGLAAGVIEATVAALDCVPTALLAWLGPAISMHAYQVGDEVRDAFAGDSEEDALAFTPDNTGAWRADLYALAANRLRRLGVSFSGGHYCTFYDAERFYSHRRDGRTGRMASLIWLGNGE